VVLAVKAVGGRETVARAFLDVVGAVLPRAPALAACGERLRRYFAGDADCDAEVAAIAEARSPPRNARRRGRPAPRRVSPDGTAACGPSDNHDIAAPKAKRPRL